MTKLKYQMNARLPRLSLAMAGRDYSDSQIPPFDDKPEPPYVVDLFPLTHNSLFPVLGPPKNEFLSSQLTSYQILPGFIRQRTELLIAKKLVSDH